jgi:hypothetical protein
MNEVTPSKALIGDLDFTVVVERDSNCPCGTRARKFRKFKFGWLYQISKLNAK